MSIIRDFVLNTAEHFYDIPDLRLNDKSEKALFEFINDTQTYLLQSSVNDKTLHLSTKIQCNVQKSIIFYKTSSLDLSKQDKINNVNMITLTTGAAESLYHILRQIFSPLLTLV
ncbi:unnamed protein product [Parnassius apollo]|uniref:(apollo) hypothetical protein n=1 Tax=Parnassius apollo TaxID=110799 RepID=A0A8S3XEI0_PARAO|nr:unnamed protein product [Parnassius apollo]